MSDTKVRLSDSEREEVANSIRNDLRRRNSMNPEVRRTLERALEKVVVDGG